MHLCNWLMLLMYYLWFGRQGNECSDTLYWAMHGWVKTMVCFHIFGPLSVTLSRKLGDSAEVLKITAYQFLTVYLHREGESAQIFNGDLNNVLMSFPGVGLAVKIAWSKILSHSLSSTLWRLKIIKISMFHSCTVQNPNLNRSVCLCKVVRRWRDGWMGRWMLLIVMVVIIDKHHSPPFWWQKFILLYINIDWFMKTF